MFNCSLQTNLKRISYLPLLIPNIRPSIPSHIPDSNIWFSYKDIPLKWNLPIGLLFDLYAVGTQVPWELKVHTRDFPADKVILMSESEKAVDFPKDFFYGLCKQVITFHKFILEELYYIWDIFLTRMS